MKKKYFYRFIKRTFDIFCSIIGIILLVPLTIVVKLCYIFTGDFKSIFYAQDRIGKHGKTIHLLKYRSMVWDADEKLKEVLKDPKHKKEWTKYRKLSKDPRITKIGRILRKTSLDEFPQFINIFIGDMSLIGPRPLVKGELDENNGDHELYESIRPGLTGWWGCNGRSDIDYDKRLELEYYYIKNCSILLDLKCIFKTIATVIRLSGAK